MTSISDLEILARLLLSAGLGAAIGLEREMRGQLAGMRTHGLVAAGAALFAVAGAYGFADVPRASTVDPARVAAQVVSGIGFIGAGAIIRDSGSVRGITTAAALWASAALGLAAGAGLYAVAGLGCAVILGTLVGLRAVRDRGLLGVGGQSQVIDITYERGHGTMGPIIAAVEQAGATLERLRIDDQERTRRVSVTVATRDHEALRAEIGRLADRVEVADVFLTSLGPSGGTGRR